MNFCDKLKKPIFMLAPMEGVTDTVFRQIVASTGKPGVFFTEFVPVDALLSPQGQKKILDSLKFTEAEKPIVAQIWGIDSEKFYQSAQILSNMGFDGIDINMGCPDRNAIKHGACSALIKNPRLAQEIIAATIRGANGLPVSVKTRIGFHTLDTENWTRVLLQTPISVLILHLRTASEKSKVPAHWDQISKVVKIKNELKSKVLIIGNGDVKTLKEAEEKCRQYKIDGVMIGRGIFENVWLFNKTVKNALPEEKISLLIKHLELFKQTWSDKKHFELMKKFVKCYVNNFKGALESREKLMKTKTLDELIQTTWKLSTYPIV